MPLPQNASFLGLIQPLTASSPTHSTDSFPIPPFFLHTMQPYFCWHGNIPGPLSCGFICSPLLVVSRPRSHAMLHLCQPEHMLSCQRTCFSSIMPRLQFYGHFTESKPHGRQWNFWIDKNRIVSVRLYRNYPIPNSILEGFEGDWSKEANETVLETMLVIQINW